MIARPTRDETWYQSLQLTSLPAVGAAPARSIINTEEESYVELQRLLALDDARNINLPGSAYGLQIEEEGGAAWFSDFICSNLIFSPGYNPRNLLTPIVVAPNAVLNVLSKPTGLVASYNAFDLALAGIKRPALTPEQFGRIRKRPYYVYVTPFGQDVAGAGEVNLDFETKSDAAFVVQNLCGAGAFNNASGTIAEWDAIRVQIYIMSDNERPLYKNPIGWFQAFGQPDYWLGPNRLLSPLVLPKRCRVRVQLTVDTTVATPGSWKCIQVGFEGYKIKD